MAKSLDQISKELSQLDTATVEIDDTLKSIYQDYLTVLGRAVKRQLVLAVYHLCTQAYPDEFLSLSVSQQEKLQAGVRKIATQGQSQIQQLGQVMDVSSLAEQLSEVMTAESEPEPEEQPEVPDSRPADSANPSWLPDEAAESSPSLFPDEIGPLPLSDRAVTDESSKNTANWDPASTTEDELETDDDELEADDEDLETDDDDAAGASREASEMIRRLSTSLSLFSVLGTEPLSPVSLAKRHVLLERHIRAILRTLSGLTNYLLKQGNILPDLPEMVIAAAIEAESGESGPSTPNILSVLVEVGGDRAEDDTNDTSQDDDEFDEELLVDDDDDREMTHLVAINLRLADIEFADTQTALWRSKLQEVLMKLKRLGSRYQKLQREKAKADAEHAWRAIWFEE